MPKEVTLDDLAKEPARAAELPAPARRQLVLRCAAVLVALATVPIEDASSDNDRLIGIEEAAGRLNIAPATLRNKRPPFRIKIGGSVRYSVAGIERYIRTRRGR